MTQAISPPCSNDRRTWKPMVLRKCSNELRQLAVCGGSHRANESTLANCPQVLLELLKALRALRTAPFVLLLLGRCVLPSHENGAVPRALGARDPSLTELPPRSPGPVVSSTTISSPTTVLNTHSRWTRKRAAGGGGRSSPPESPSPPLRPRPSALNQGRSAIPSVNGIPIQPGAACAEG